MTALPEIRREPLRSSVDAALSVLERLWQLPDGTELVDARDVAFYRRQIANGFYYRLVFPAGWSREDCVRFYELVTQARELGLL